MEYIMLMFLSLGANLIKKIWGAKQMFSKISEDCKTIKCVGKHWHINIENEWQVLAMSYMWNDGSWAINKVLFVDFCSVLQNCKMYLIVIIIRKYA